MFAVGVAVQLRRCEIGMVIKKSKRSRYLLLSSAESMVIVGSYPWMAVLIFVNAGIGSDVRKP